MTDRDLLEPADPAGPGKHRTVARSLASVPGVLGRLASRQFRSRRPMSDAELREAFRLASLTLTSAPFDRPSRRDGVSPHGEADEAEAKAMVVPAPTPTHPAAVAPSRADPLTETVATATATPAPMAAWAGSAATHASQTTPALGTAADGLRPIAPLPEPDPADEVQLPGNLRFSVDDFFGGLVRRVERRP